MNVSNAILSWFAGPRFARSAGYNDPTAISLLGLRPNEAKLAVQRLHALPEWDVLWTLSGESWNLDCRLFDVSEHWARAKRGPNMCAHQRLTRGDATAVSQRDTAQ
jgi:hypothetical protein